ADLEAANPRLLEAKKNRSRVEYYFTCSPTLPLYILQQHPELDLITYLDADLFFFADPKPLFDELAGHSVAITAHRYAPLLRKRVRFGKYNVGWLSFRRDANALACLEWWRDRCLEWCYDRLEADRYADQKYLDRWPELFQGVHVLEHKGANVGAWNIANYRVTARDGNVWMDEQPLIFFHFQGVKQLLPSVYDSALGISGVRASRVIRRAIFQPYLNTLQRVTPPDAVKGSVRKAELRFGTITRAFRWTAKVIIGIIMGQYLILYRNRVL
ncbi:MAG: hypothetical protein QHJ73_03815, partial [Armatimonadota bacterium]|nr:hypothetical protein [Armatimonadota bacterium]